MISSTVKYDENLGVNVSRISNTNALILKFGSDIFLMRIVVKSGT